jgi:hypothetical protein
LPRSEEQMGRKDGPARRAGRPKRLRAKALKRALPIATAPAPFVGHRNLIAGSVAQARRHFYCFPRMYRFPTPGWGFVRSRRSRATIVRIGIINPALEGVEIRGRVRPPARHGTPDKRERISGRGMSYPSRARPITPAALCGSFKICQSGRRRTRPPRASGHRVRASPYSVDRSLLC